MATARGSRDTRGGRGGVRGRPFSTVSSRNGSDDDQTRTRPHNNNRTDPTTRGGGLQQTQQPFAQSTNSSQGTRGSGIARSKRFTSNASPAAANLLLDQSWRATCKAGDPAYPKRMSDLYQTLKKNREQERKESIRNGTLSDPSKPTRLKDAITPVGTCQEMCPQFERVERIVQQMVDGSEKITLEGSDALVPCEDHMVKRFRRSAAGYDEQLPSDIRPPLVLQKTLDYLIEEVVGGPKPLGKVHKFVWDRTRSIRNDFSIQQVTKLHDVRTAINCFERIARFHLLALHQLSQPGNPDFDHYQEREQLSNTLLSLTYYYNDNRENYTSPNEAEFRAYCTIFEIQDQRPDLEDRAQLWPRTIFDDPQIQTALTLHAAAQNTQFTQGPLNPKARHPIAQQNTSRFFTLTASDAVSYTMACVCEIYFNQIRTLAIDDIVKAYKRGGGPIIEDLILADMTKFLGFDTEKQAEEYCEDHGFRIVQRADGQKFIDVKGIHHVSDSKHPRKQVFSKNLVEKKRLGRTFPAIINGFSGSRARSLGMLDETTSTPVENSDNELFFREASDGTSSNRSSKPQSPQMEEMPAMAALPNPFSKPLTSIASMKSSTNPFAIVGNANPFASSHQKISGQTSAAPNTSVSSSAPISAFGKPSGLSAVATTFGQPTSINRFPKPLEPTVEKLAESPSVTSSLSGLPGPTTTLPKTDTSQVQPISTKPTIPSSKSFIFAQPSATSVLSSPAVAPSGFVFGKPNLASATNSVFAQPPTTTASLSITSEAPKFTLSNDGGSGSQSLIFGQPSTKENGPATSLFAGSKTSSGFVFKAPTAPMSIKPSTSPFLPTISPPNTSSNQIAEESGNPQSLFSQPSGSTFSPTSQIDKAPTFSKFPIASTSTLQLLGEQSPKDVASKPTSSLFQVPSHRSSTEQSAGQNTPLLPAKHIIPALPSILPTTETSPATDTTLNLLESTPPVQFALHYSLTQPVQSRADTRSESTSKEPPTPTFEITPPSFTLTKPQGQNPLIPNIANVSFEKLHQSSQPISQLASPSASPLAKSALSFPSPKERLINRLAEPLVTDKENGLLDMFLDWNFTKGSFRKVIEDAVKTVEAEREQERATTYRRLYLSLAYTRKWRARAWKRSLIRKDNERRKNLLALERSLREERREKERYNLRMSRGMSQSSEGVVVDQLNGKVRETAMLPPPKPIASKRKSLPGDFTDMQPSKEDPSTEHRHKREKLSHSVPEKPHRRSYTLGGSGTSSRDSKLSSSASSLSPYASRLSDGRPIDEKMRAQARRLASGIGPTDTTHTDYFKLKSMGIDPDTPIVPRTKTLNGSQLMSRNTVTSPPTPKVAAITNGTASLERMGRADDDLETLLAEARKVRETLAEDEHWFREERMKNESKKRRLSEETEKEKKLREWKPSPSRTSVRLEATGAQGLFQKKDMETPTQTPKPGDEKRRDTPVGGNVLGVQPLSFASLGSSSIRPRGFASLSGLTPGLLTPSNGFRPGLGNFNGFGAFGGASNNNATTIKGASSDDAIEL